MAKTTILMFALRYCFIGLLALAGSVAAQVPLTNAGAPIQINLKPDKSTVMLGEPLFLAFEITNLSGDKLGLALGGDYRNQYGRPDSFTVTVKRSDGTELPYLRTLNMGGLSGWDAIEVGATYTIKLFLPHWATIDRVGVYRVNVKRMMSFANYEPARPAQRKYSFLADVDTEFTVVPYDEDRMGGIINSFGSIMLDVSDPRAVDSAEALRALNDKRVIPYFAEALRKFADPQDIPADAKTIIINRRAIAALGTYDDDRAIEALQGAVNSRTDDTRLAIANALSDNPHRSAIKLLLTMRDDEYGFVRLRVAQALKKVKTNEARAILHKLLNDEDEGVRRAARDSLNEINK